MKKGILVEKKNLIVVEQKKSQVVDVEPE